MTQEPMEHRNAGYSIEGGHKEAPDLGHMLPGGHWQLWETMQCLQFSKTEKKKMCLEAWQPPCVQLLMGSQWYLDTQMTNGSEMSDSISDL